MQEPVETITLKGFDPNGEPEIRVMPSGELYLVFNFMPPEKGEDLGLDFSNFDKELTEHLGVEVIWGDREFFHIPAPKSDTIKKIKKFTSSYWKKIDAKNKPPSMTERIESHMGPHLEPLGFKRRRGEGFFRRWPGGFENISFGLAEYHPVYKLQFFATVRLDVVEDIVNRFSGILSGYERSSATANIRLDWFTRRFRTEYELTYDGDVAGVLQPALDLIVKHMVPLLENCRTPQQMLAFFNEPPRAQYVVFNNGAEPKNAMAHVTLAWLVERSTFEGLVQTYCAKLREWTSPQRDGFDKLIGYLRSQ